MLRLARARNERGQWTYIGLLLGVAIIAVLVVVLFGSGSKISPTGRIEQAAKEGDVKVKPGQTTLGAVMDKSKDPVCRNNLQQIRAYLQIEQSQEGTFPSTLDARKIGSGSILNCPLSSRPYSYDPSKGTVKCTTPGHEGF